MPEQQSIEPAEADAPVAPLPTVPVAPAPPTPNELRAATMILEDALERDQRDSEVAWATQAAFHDANRRRLEDLRSAVNRALELL